MELRFPFDEASRVAAEARALASDLHRLGRLLEQDLGTLSATSFAGMFAHWLAAAGDDAHLEVTRLASALEDQADRVESSIGHAHVRVADRSDQIMRYERRLRRWSDWTEPVRAGSP